jgi:thiol-disulfide isomerase/thioredoxin
MNPRRQLLLLGATALVAGGAGVFLAQQRRKSDPTNSAEFPGEAHPLPDLTGAPHALSEWAGKVLVVNFWATWCPPCLTEIPGFVALQQELGPQGLQFVGIALDDTEAVREFAESKNMNYPLLVGEEPVMALMREFGNAHGGLPYTVVIGRSGALIHTKQGEWEQHAARAVLMSLLQTGDKNHPEFAPKKP